MAKRPKVKVFCVLINEVGTHHLVWRAHDDTQTPDEFHRLLGGHLEHGETLEHGIVREIFEEVGYQLTAPKLLGHLESIYTNHAGPGHEIVFVYAERLKDFTRIGPEGGWLVDNTDSIWVEWLPIAGGGDIPLYPQGVQQLIDANI